MILRGWAIGALAALLPCTEDARAAGADWWDDDWELRLPIHVEPAAGVLSMRPVVVRWSQLVAAGAAADVQLSSLRLVREGRPVPFQFDHRDGDGDYVTGDLGLDEPDELAFIAPGDVATTTYLYLSRAPKLPATFAPGLRPRSRRAGRARSHWNLSTAGLAVDVQADGQLDPFANALANHGRGAVVGLVWRGRRLTSNVNWSIALNQHPLSGPGPADRPNRWRRATCVVNGPVRTIVRLDRPDHRRVAGERVVLRADATRWFVMFTGVPLYDVHDVIRFHEVPSRWVAGHTDKFLPGGVRDEHDVLWDGSTGTPRRFALADHDVGQHPNGSLVDNEQVADGWYLWLDDVDGTGLAVCYGAGSDDGLDAARPAHVAFRAGWEMWSNVNTVSFVYEALAAPVTVRHRFRVIGVAGVGAEQVAGEHRRFVAGSDGGPVRIGAAEVRP